MPPNVYRCVDTPTCANASPYVFTHMPARAYVCPHMLLHYFMCWCM